MTLNKSWGFHRQAQEKKKPLIKEKVAKYNYTKIINLNTMKNHLKQNLKDKS